MKKSLLGIFILAFGFQSVFSQSDIEGNDFRIMFYNVENLFDPFDDSLTRDEEFTSEGSRHWSWGKYQTKLNQIYKVFMAAGNPYPPAIIGLSEIENRFVLKQLVYETAFSKFNYRIVHEESPDRRGIDVALLFDPKRFELLYHKAINVDFPFKPDSKTRDILYVKGVVLQTDTIHVFVNHWPSRWGGQMATDPKRKRVADILKSNTDSLFAVCKNPLIVIIGDFNDYPNDESLRLNLEAGSVEENKDLVNLMLAYSDEYGIGSNKYKGNWGMLDQIIVSKNMLMPESLLQIKQQKAFIFNASFLLEPDEKYTGERPNRTSIGYKYHGGYSDHLPVYIDIFTE
ncbi:MAG: endonuclease [Bacteroidales bacterium]|nr:endonuclease [Bacteroidales bacterium]